MRTTRKLRNMALVSAAVLTLGISGNAIAMNKDAMSKGVPTTIEGMQNNASNQYVRENLQKLGFTEVKDVSHSGNIYQTQAKWNGRWMTLSIDARHGGIDIVPSGGSTISVMQSETNDDIRRQLEGMGYRSVGEIKRSGDVIETTAMVHGKMTKLSIDARTGAVSTPLDADTAIALPKSGMDTAYLTEQLRPLGYSGVRNVERSGDVYALEAMKNGKRVNLSINAANGKVTQVN